MHNDKADALEHQHEALVADVGRMEEVLDKLLARDLNDVKIAEVTHKIDILLNIVVILRRRERIFSKETLS